MQLLSLASSLSWPLTSLGCFYAPQMKSFVQNQVYFPMSSPYNYFLILINVTPLETTSHDVLAFFPLKETRNLLLFAKHKVIDQRVLKLTCHQRKPHFLSSFLSLLNEEVTDGNKNTSQKGA